MKKHLMLFIVAFLSIFQAYAQTGARKIEGVVLDENGGPLAGALISNASSTKGAMADGEGKFSITLPASDKFLIVSFLGYDNQNVDISAKNEVTIIMVPDKSTTLNEVVVIGYGQVKRQDLTGSVASVRMSDIESTTTLAVDEALQGRIAGVDIMSTTGEPGATTSIRIRGTRSITASNEPLIVVDGVIDAVTDLNDINSDDIESISVLKDASSTAIYGARGANGVVIVTTKKGVTSKPAFNVAAEFGVSQLARKLDLMNAEEFMRYYNDYYALNAPGASNSGGLHYDPASISRDTDWQDEITRIAPYQNYRASMSGKTGAIKYYASLGYTDKQGIIDGNGLQRFTARLNLTFDVTKWFSIGYKGSYTYTHNKPNQVVVGGKSPYTGAIYLSPLIGPYDRINPLYENGNAINTPRASIDYQQEIRDYHNSNNVLEFVFKPVRGLTIKSQNSYYRSQRHHYRFYPSYMPKKVEGEGSDAYRAEGDVITIISENTASYSRKFKSGHYFDVLGGFTSYFKKTNDLSLNAEGLLVDKLTWNNMNGIGSKENYTAASNAKQFTKMSFIARANYNFKQRYYLTFTGRYDGASNFAVNNKWGFFPSGAFKWNVMKEPFMRTSHRWLDELALRVSVGLTGNDDIPAYRSMKAYASTSSGYPFDGVNSSDYYYSRIPNPDLTWEKTLLGNIAVDFSAFDGRLGITAEAYASRTTDLLLTVQTATSTGFANRYSNLGLTTNKGVELTLNTRNIVTDKFEWNSTLTLTHNNQMVEDIGHEEYVIALASPDDFMMYGYKAGYPLNSLWGFEYLGTVKDMSEVTRNKYTRTWITDYPGRADAKYEYQLLGAPKYADQNHDGELSSDDLIYLGNSDPFLYGGFQNNFHLGNFKLSVYFAYSLGGRIYNYSEIYMGGGYRTNQYRYMLDAYHPVRNPDSDIPTAGYDAYITPNSRFVHDASYLRLKNLSLSYAFNFRKNKHIKNLTLTASCDNLWLWTRYNGYDPDVSTENDGSTLRRVDLGAYPRARMYMLKASIRF